MTSVNNSDVACPFLRHARAHEIAVVCLGNTLRADDGVGAMLVSGLTAELQSQICILDAGCYTRDLPAFLSGHHTGIIVDAVEPGSSQALDKPVIVDLTGAKQQAALDLNMDCCHALSWFHELIICKDQVTLPSRLMFFGVPAVDTGWRQGLSDDMKNRLPGLIHQLGTLIEDERASKCTKPQ